MDARERMANALATWVRTLNAHYHDLFNRNSQGLNFGVLKDEVERAIREAVEAEREACARTAEILVMPGAYGVGEVVAARIRARSKVTP